MTRNVAITNIEAKRNYTVFTVTVNGWSYRVSVRPITSLARDGVKTASRCIGRPDGKADSPGHRAAARRAAIKHFTP